MSTTGVLRMAQCRDIHCAGVGPPKILLQGVDMLGLIRGLCFIVLSNAVDSILL